MAVQGGRRPAARPDACSPKAKRAAISKPCQPWHIRALKLPKAPDPVLGGRSCDFRHACGPRRRPEWGRGSDLTVAARSCDQTVTLWRPSQTSRRRGVTFRS